MRNGRQPRGLALGATAIALAAAALLGGGCGDDDDPGPAGRGPSPEDPGTRRVANQGGACELLDDEALAAVFPDGVPDPMGTSMGTGFAECEWGRSREGTVVLLSLLPAVDFQSDYVDQLAVTTPVAGVGDSAVRFPGFVGIGRGSAGGGSVGFTKGDRAVLVAVRTGGDPSADADVASELAVVVADRL